MSIKRKIDYQITQEDFLFLALELDHDLKLVEIVAASGNANLGFAKPATVTKGRKLRGYVRDGKRTAVQTDTGWVMEAGKRLACVSSLDFKLEYVDDSSRISYEGQLYSMEHQNEYTHNGLSIYHEIEIKQISEAFGQTVVQPDSTLDYIPLTTPINNSALGF